MTRFPPEPNGYLHIGHAKAFLLDFGIADEFGGKCNLRFDDTNPEREDVEYVDAQREDLKWMGCDWGDREYFASDYYEQLYEWAVYLVKQGKAYVDDLSQEQMREHRGTPTEPGRNSPLPRPRRRGKPRPPRADEARRVRRGALRPAREDRHGAPEPRHARPDDVPHPQGAPSPHRRQVVHLPDVRLCPLPLRRDRGRDPLALRHRLREQPRALRLVHQQRPRPGRRRTSTSSRGSTSPTR